MGVGLGDQGWARKFIVWGQVLSAGPILRLFSASLAAIELGDPNLGANGAQDMGQNEGALGREDGHVGLRNPHGRSHLLLILTSVQTFEQLLQPSDLDALLAGFSGHGDGRINHADLQIALAQVVHNPWNGMRIAEIKGGAEHGVGKASPDALGLEVLDPEAVLDVEVAPGLEVERVGKVPGAEDQAPKLPK